MTPYEAYCLYTSLKTHFTKLQYDYIKYNGSMKLKISNFNNRNDRYFFTKLCKYHDPKGLIISNLLYSNNTFIKHIIDNGEDAYLKWKKINSSLEYYFKQDLYQLNSDFFSNFTIIDNKLPHILQLYISNKISLETVVIMMILTKSENDWINKLNGNILWDHELKIKIIKYAKFFTIDNKKLNVYRKIVVDFFKKA